MVVSRPANAIALLMLDPQQMRRSALKKPGQERLEAERGVGRRGADARAFRPGLGDVHEKLVGHLKVARPEVTDCVRE